ncbi:Probable carboxylesterase LipT [Mycobacteroides abscessus subsp. massiliense]|nr:Probable carboxylesterase LipT [Mycobacteroides abscessus subsp. massiliense]
MNTLLAVPSAAGLFHRAICQSTASGLVVSAQDAVVNARQFAKYLGATDSNAAETVLSAKPKNLVKALFRLIGSAKHIHPGGAGARVVQRRAGVCSARCR